MRHHRRVGIDLDGRLLCRCLFIVGSQQVTSILSRPLLTAVLPRRRLSVRQCIRRDVAKTSFESTNPINSWRESHIAAPLSPTGASNEARSHRQPGCADDPRQIFPTRRFTSPVEADAHPRWMLLPRAQQVVQSVWHRAPELDACTLLRRSDGSDRFRGDDHREMFREIPPSRQRMWPTRFSRYLGSNPPRLRTAEISNASETRRSRSGAVRS